MSDLVDNRSRQLGLSGNVTHVSLELPRDLSFEDWQGTGQTLMQMERSVLWWIGDWWAFGDHKYAERAAQAVDSRYSIQTLMDAGWVCRHIETSRRREVLSFSHHREVAAIEDPAEQDHWLDQAEQEGWTRAELRAAIKRSKRRFTENPKLPDGKFAVLYADPPWTFEAWSGEGKDRAAENHYPTMTQEQIEALPVADLAADNCALFIWAVMPQLPEALAVIEAWGFEYKTCAFVWVKTTKDGERFATGMGYWTRANAELCLLATRGSPERLNADVHQVVYAPRGDHSAKPEEIAARIERLISGPYVELFARQARPGWEVWGNEVVAGEAA